MPPQNTRPRYVSPPLPLLMPDFTTPPTFPVGGSGTGGVEDLIAQLTGLINQPLPTIPQPVNPGGVKGFFQGLLQALPEGIGVGLSAVPEAGNAGPALLNLIAQKRAQAFQQQQINQQRLDRNEMMKRELGIDLLKGEITEQRATAREERERKFKVEERESEEATRFALANLEIDTRTALANSENKLRRELAGAQIENDAQGRSITIAEGLEELGVPSKIARSYAAKAARGQLDKITKEEQGFVDAARAIGTGRANIEFGLKVDKYKSEIEKNKAEAERDRAFAAGGGAGGSQFEKEKKATERYSEELAKALRTPLVTLVDPNNPDGETSPIELESLPKDPLNAPQIKRYLTVQERLAYFNRPGGAGEALLKGAAGFAEEQLKMLEGAPQALDAKAMDVYVDTMIQKGATPEDMLGKVSESTPEMQEALTGAIIRAQKAGKFNSVESAAKSVTGVPDFSQYASPMSKLFSGIGQRIQKANVISWLQGKINEAEYYLTQEKDATKKKEIKVYLDDLKERLKVAQSDTPAPTATKPSSNLKFNEGSQFDKSGTEMAPLRKPQKKASKLYPNPSTPSPSGVLEGVPIIDARSQ